MVCMGNGVKDRFVVAHDKTNGQTMKFDET
jgi:hypothetical protein